MNRQSIVHLAGTLALSAGVLLAVPGLVGSAAASETSGVATSSVAVTGSHAGRAAASRGDDHGRRHHPLRHRRGTGTTRRKGNPASGGSTVSVSLTATASTTSGGQGFLKAQQALELELTNRQHQLAKLTADVAGSKTLTQADESTLSSRLTSETSSIATLAAKVPSDTTFAELRADAETMLRENRVYAVMTPQVFEVIEADAISAQITMLQGQEASLSADVSSLVGQPGYRTAASHYRSFVARVEDASRNTVDVSTAVIAQTPLDYPGDTHVFVEANHKLLAADLDVAYASYDASVIGLATGGYTGS